MKTHEDAFCIIKNALETKGIDYNYLCSKLNIDRTRFLSCLKGQGALSASEFISVCIFLGLNLEDFKKCYCV